MAVSAEDMALDPTSHGKSSLFLGQRDLRTVQTALNGINAALANLDSAIVNENVGPCILPLVTNVLTSIQSAMIQIQASPPLTSLTDASDLKATTDGLTANVNLTVSDLIKDLPNFEILGLVSQVTFVLHVLRFHAVGLANTIAGQVPAELSSVAAQAVQNLESTIDRGIAAFSSSGGGGCAGRGGGGASPTDRASSLLPPTWASPAANSSSAALRLSGTVQHTPSPTGSTMTSLATTNSRSSSTSQPTTSNSLIYKSPSESFGGVFAPLPVPDTFVPGQSCFCICPVIAQSVNGFLLVGP